MKQTLLWNDNWYFAKTLPEVTWEEQDKWREKLEKVDLPHDWLIYNTLDLYENSIGWYVKEFELEAAFENADKENASCTAEEQQAGDSVDLEENRVILRFDGVYMDSTVYVNGQKLEEPYLNLRGITNTAENEVFRVPEGCYFVLGDNRRSSDDSRFWDDPYVSEEDIRAEVLLIVSVHKDNTWRGIRAIT